MLVLKHIFGRVNLRTSECHNILVPSTKTQLGRRSFHVAAPAVWNVLPPHLRSSSISRGQFRAGLKTHLFTQAHRHLCGWCRYVLIRSAGRTAVSCSEKLCSTQNSTLLLNLRVGDSCTVCAVGFNVPLDTVYFYRSFWRWPSQKITRLVQKTCLLTNHLGGASKTNVII